MPSLSAGTTTAAPTERDQQVEGEPVAAEATGGGKIGSMQAVPRNYLEPDRIGQDPFPTGLARTLDHALPLLDWVVETAPTTATPTTP